MKSYFVLFLFVLVACLPASASQVTLPFTFSAGTPARAADVNANFAAVKAAVDDNFARITAAGSVSIPGQSFLPQIDFTLDQCGLNRGNPNAFFQGTSTTCSAVAGISLPNAATITGLSCFVKDTATGAPGITQAILSRYDVVVESFSALAVTLGSSDSPGIQTLSGSVAVNGQVDNSKYVYSIQVDFDGGGSSMSTAGIGFNLGLYGCSVAYHP
jgi:hypothetical protein